MNLKLYGNLGMLMNQLGFLSASNTKVVEYNHCNISSIINISHKLAICQHDVNPHHTHTNNQIIHVKRV